MGLREGMCQDPLDSSLWSAGQSIFLDNTELWYPVFTQHSASVYLRMQSTSPPCLGYFSPFRCNYLPMWYIFHNNSSMWKRENPLWLSWRLIPCDTEYSASQCQAESTAPPWHLEVCRGVISWCLKAAVCAVHFVFLRKEGSAISELEFLLGHSGLLLLLPVGHAGRGKEKWNANHRLFEEGSSWVVSAAVAFGGTVFFTWVFLDITFEETGCFQPRELLQDQGKAEILVSFSGWEAQFLSPFWSWCLRPKCTL